MRLTRFLIPIIAAASVFISGCSTLLGANQAASAAVQAGIQLVTALYIQHKGGGTPAGEAQVAVQVAQIATTLEGLVQGNVTVAQFNSAMQQYIAKLNPTQQIIATELLTQIDLYFQQVIAGKGTLVTATTAAAATLVLNDVIAACAFFQQAPNIKALHASFWRRADGPMLAAAP